MRTSTTIRRMGEIGPGHNVIAFYEIVPYSEEKLPSFRN